MNALEYFKEQKRMCESMGVLCTKCPFSIISDQYGYSDCLDIEHENPEMAITAVEQWSVANPIFTNANKFEEVFGIDINTQSISSSWWDKPYKIKS